MRDEHTMFSRLLFPTAMSPMMIYLKMYSCAVVILLLQLMRAKQGRERKIVIISDIFMLIFMKHTNLYIYILLSSFSLSVCDLM